MYASHFTELRAFLIGVLRNHDLAQDALQAVFGKLVELGHTAQEETQKGWLFKVAYHEALVLRRRQAIHQKSLMRLVTVYREQTGAPDQSLGMDK